MFVISYKIVRYNKQNDKRNFVLSLEKRLKEKNLLMQVVIGPRQVGKTTGVKQILDSWKGKKLFISADGLEKFNQDWLYLNWQNALELGENALFVIDEIQKINNWSEIVKDLYDKNKDKNLKIILLCSASLKLQKGLTESLAGRYELLKVNHWRLSEGNLNFKEFLQFGGYPASYQYINDEIRFKDYINNSIIENVLSKDLVQITEIRNPSLLRQIYYLINQYPAQEISFQKLVGQLQDKGALSTVKHYLEILESAFLIKLLYKYSENPISNRSSSPKIIPLANSLISSVTNKNINQDSMFLGRVFEASIGSFLNQFSDEIYYWREGKQEVDFIAKINGKSFAIEVNSGQIKGLSSLKYFCDKFPDFTPIIIDYEKGKKLLNTNPQEIRVNPKILLEL